ncbi:MAG: energy transducer TonB, partial [Tannerella sp.]|nr:energy transducer TonB [Tannerella sp.]
MMTVTNKKEVFAIMVAVSMTVLFVHAYEPCTPNQHLEEYGQLADRDTIIYNGNTDTYAELPDAISYFRQNNRFKDWDSSNKKVVFIQGTVEKDGSITNAVIRRSSNLKQLDDEALRLIKNAKYRPATLKGQNVRCKFSIAVDF